MTVRFQRHHRRSRRDVPRQPDGPTNATIADGQGTGTITNDDSAPPALASTTSRSPKATAGGAADLHRHAVGGEQPEGDGELRHRRRHGARRAPTHRRQRHADLRAGETSRPVTVAVIGDTAPEGDETLLPSACRRRSTPRLPRRRLGTITNDDLPSLTLGNASVAEGNGGTTNAIFTGRCRPPAADGQRSTTPPPTAPRRPGPTTPRPAAR